MKYPLPAFHFQVDWNGETMEIAEVSGLVMERQSIEYRHGMMKDQTGHMMPGIPKFSNITLKRGMTNGNNEFFDWLNTAALNTIERRDLTISLLNEEHAPVTNWKVNQAWPVKVEGPGLKATGNEVAIESIELAHEGITVEVP